METIEAIRANSSLLSGERAQDTGRIAENPMELIDLRDTMRKIEYSERVRQETDPEKLPPNVKALRDKLDTEAVRLVNPDEAERDFLKNVPQIALRELKDEDPKWVEFGWDQDSRNEVKRKLSERLGLDPNRDRHRLENLLHMLIATGQTPQEVLDNLNDNTKFDPYINADFSNENDPIARQAVPLMERYGLTQESAVKYLYLIQQQGLDNKSNRVNDKYIQRFVLDDEFRGWLDSEYDNSLPQNLFDLAWNIGYREKDYSMNGSFPTLQMQVEQYTDENGKERVRGRYVANQGNIIRWLRNRLYQRWDWFETDEVPNFYDLIKIDKGVMATVSLGTMIFDKSRYFTDETGQEWNNLFNNVFIEPWMLLWERQYAVMYNNASDTEDELVKAYQEMTRLSKFTRRVGDMSMPHRGLSAALDYKGRDSDTKVGEAMLQMYLTYYNLPDYDMLKRLLGEDSIFFTRDGWIKAATTHFGKVVAPSTINALTGKFFGDREIEFKDAFEEVNGKWVVTEKTKDHFIKFINVYTQEQPAQDVIKTLAEMLKLSVKDKFYSEENTVFNEKTGEVEKAFDQGSLNYAWLKALSWTLFTGVVARNNFPSVWGQPETRWQHSRKYRRKYMTFGGAGFERDIDQIKKTMLPLMEGLLVHNKVEKYLDHYDDHGEPVYKDRYLTPMEVMLEMHKVSLEFDTAIKKLERERDSSETSAARKETIEKEIIRLKEIGKNMYRSHTNELEFNENAMRIWSKNIVAKGKAVYDYLMKGKEASFDKYTTYDSIFRGASFNRADWQESLQPTLITPLRYLYEANGATQFNIRMREPEYVGRGKDGKEVWKYTDMWSGEALLGHDTLDIPEFRMTMQDIKAYRANGDDRWQPGWRKRGKYIVDANGRHVINYDKVQGNKTAVWKEAMLTILAARLRGHIDLHSTDPAYSLEHYLNIIEAIERLPGDIASSEFDMNKVAVTKYLFSKEQMKRLKQKASATRMRLYNRAFWSDLFIGDKKKKEAGVGDSVSIMLSAIFRGYN